MGNAANDITSDLTKSAPRLSKHLTTRLSSNASNMKYQIAVFEIAIGIEFDGSGNRSEGYDPLAFIDLGKLD